MITKTKYMPSIATQVSYYQAASTSAEKASKDESVLYLYLTIYLVGQLVVWFIGLSFILYEYLERKRKKTMMINTV
jgi:hypothetical protein